LPPFRDKTAVLEALCRDLEAEQHALDAVLVGLSDPDWDLATPAEGWTIRDQVGHLAFSEDMAALAVEDPDTFKADMGRGIDYIEPHERAARAKGNAMEAAELVAWWQRGRAALIHAVRTLGAGARIPWEGPSMSPLSFLTARLMETFAHGQDIRDTVGVRADNTDRLRHVAHLGVITRHYTYTIRGLDAPPADPRIELATPAGIHTWGPEDAADRVTGDALDFCLVVTQRRHHLDTGLVVTGDDTREWLEIAQAFAGHPTTGPPQGHFVT
jgi:uncharacterized protein (TIGR03084 family)